MRSGLREATAPSSITQHRATRSELLNFVSAEGFTPLHYVCDGRVGSRQAAAAIVSQVQERELATASVNAGGVGLDASANCAAGGGGDTGDSEGSPDDSNDRVEILRWLLLEPEMDQKMRVPRGATTLHLAAHTSGSQGANLVRLLIETGGVNLDVLDAPVTVNKVVCNQKQINMTCPRPAPGSLLLPGELNEAGDGGDTPLRFSALHYALQAASWEAANLLLSAGARVRVEGAFPPCLHVACLAGAPASLVSRLTEEGGELATTLADNPVSAVAVQKGGALLNTSGHADAKLYAATPLFLAAVAGSAELIAMLLSTCGIDTPQILGTTDEETKQLEKEDDGDPGVRGLQRVWLKKHSPSDNRSPLHAAAVEGHTAAARALLDAERNNAGNGPPSSWVNTADTTGFTPLDLAVSRGKWECANLLASDDRFDVRLAVEGGPSSALLTAERTNMAIVDEGRGDAQALSALRESNTLIMTLLKRLSAVATEESIMAAAAAAVTTTTASCEEESTVGAADTEHTSLGDVGEDTMVEVAITGKEKLSTVKHFNGSKHDDAAEDTPLAPAATRLLPAIHHLHPCFAEGVLYSNAKGIFIPDSPERRKRRASTSLLNERTGVADELAAAVNADRHRAAVIIQSRARQAGAKRFVAAKKGQRQIHKRPSSAPGARRAIADQERAAIVIQAQARQASARAETARRREQKWNDKQQGEVGAAVVTKVPTKYQSVPPPAGGGG